MKIRRLFLFFGVATLVASHSALAGMSDHKASDHKGFFVQAGSSGTIDLDVGDNLRNLDIGPGAFVGIGHNWGLFGVRTNFHYAQMDGRNDRVISRGLSTDLYGSSLELKVSPLGESDMAFQPYIVAGAGAHYFEGNRGPIKTGDWGFAGNGGVGFDLFLVDGLALTLETNIRPSVFYQDPKQTNRNSYDVYFYDFMGGITYVFGKHDEPAAPTPVAAAPAATPAPTPKPARATRIDLKGEINFKTASAEILPASYPVLDDAVAKMKAHPELAVVEVEGHTDARGNDAYNMDLSQRRADSVKKYFESKGIAPARLRSKGYGETKPIAPNTTKEGMAKNRRIVFSVVEYTDR